MTSARPGRPSRAVERTEQILDAFLALIAERGLERTTLDDVARTTGIQRSVIRHYVGNRSELVGMATDRLVARYEQLIRAAIGDAPPPKRIVDHLFSAAWSTSMSTEDRALDELYLEAARHEPTRVRLRAAYALLVDELAGAIRRAVPGRTAAAARHAAYQVVCLAEHDAVLQQLGFPRSQSTAAHRLALDLIS